MSLMVVWVALLFGGFVSISYYRQQQFEQRIEKNIVELEKAIEENSMDFKKEWETLDKSDPVEISRYFRSELSSLYCTHFLDYNKYAQNLEKSFLRGTFQTQANEYTVLMVHYAILFASHPVTGEWDCDTVTNQPGNYCEMLSAYFSQDQSFTWEEFVGSEDYAAFLTEFYHLQETKEEVTLQEAYKHILDYEEGIASENFYQKALLQSYVYLAQTAYNDYYTHKNQNDFIEASMDAEIVYSVNGLLHNVDEASAATLVSMTPLRTGVIYVHNSVLDITAVFVLSTWIVMAIGIVLRLQKELHNELQRQR